MVKNRGRVCRISEPNIELAAKVVLGGGVIVYPTDTVYGLGCDPRNSIAVERVSRIKRREQKPFPVLCDSLDSVSRLIVFSDASRALAKKYWPGALTIVAPLKMKLPGRVHQGTRTLGVRIPASTSCVKLISACGGYLVGTSANRSGKPSCRTAQEALKFLGEEVDLILDGGRLIAQASTVVRVAGEEIEVLRKGEIRVLEKNR